MSIKTLQDRVVAQMDLPKPIRTPDTGREITEQDVKNIKSKKVLEELLKLLKSSSN